MALQNYMTDLMEAAGAQTVVVVADDVTNHTFEMRASRRRSHQQNDTQLHQRESKTEQEHDPHSPCPLQLRRESSESLQSGLVSMNNSPLRGQFCHQKRTRGGLLEEINRLPLGGEQRLPRSRTPTLKRKQCIFEPPTNDT